MPLTAQTRAERTGAGRDGVVTTVVLPAYNEAEALPQVLSDLGEHLDDSYEVLVVDDGSTDDTAEVASGYPVRVVKHPGNRGKGVAIRTGIAQAKGRNIIIMDADATYPVEAIDQLVELLTDHDMVRGTRGAGDEHIPWLNRVGNWFFNKLLTISHGLEGSDHLSGLYGLRRDAFERLDLEATGFDIETEIGVKARAHGLRTAEIPISYAPRVGEKKLSPWRDGARILGRVVVLLVIYNPTLTFIVPGIVFMAAAITGALLLSQGPVVTPYLGLNIHSFIVAALGVLGAFQFTVFGVAAALYGVEAGKPPRPWLVRLVSTRVRLIAAGIGLLLTTVSAAKLIQLTISWAGAGVFTDTRALVLATAFLVLGLQILSAALFLSIFSGRLSRYEESHLQHTQHSG